ncbi:hypothetical protein [Metabacillus lacus]|uniref:hypothetical protein n=1 Tax=Metabacillus lacus TaxID=1983721 RepID=UPI001BADCC03|nr:hypothetical protein [Metabacillus lacus]
MDNRGSNPSNVIIQGYRLNGSRILYILELVVLNPNQVVTRNFFADVDAFQFVFTVEGAGASETEISVWGRDSDGQLVAAHRLVADELLGTGGMTGPTGPAGPAGPPGATGATGPAGSSSISAYGSLYGGEFYRSINSFDNVDFTIPGPAQNVIVSTETDSITVLSPGIYEITAHIGFTGLLNAAVEINGDEVIPQSQFQAFSNNQQDLIYSGKTFHIFLNAGDVITLLIQGFIPDSSTYSLPALTVKKLS